MDDTADPTGQPPNQPPRDSGITMQRPAIVAILYLLNAVVPFSGVVGVVLAYAWRGEAQDWERTHYTYLIRTFWIGLTAFVMLFVGMFVTLFGMAGLVEGRSNAVAPAGLFSVMLVWMLLWLALMGWTVARAILSLVRAGERRPMPNPRTLLF